MDNVEEIERDGIKWLLGAGVFAIFVASLLWYIDDSLTYSSAPEIHYQELKDLRESQANLNSQPTDSRSIK